MPVEKIVIKEVPIEVTTQTTANAPLRCVLAHTYVCACPWDDQVPVEKIVEKTITKEVPVEKVVYKEVEVEVEKVVTNERIVEVEKIVRDERIVEVEKYLQPGHLLLSLSPLN